MIEKSEGGIPPQEKVEKLHTIEFKGGGSIVVEEIEPGRFKIVNDSITRKGRDRSTDSTDIGFDEWDESVEDLDDGTSDISQSYGMSVHLKWEDVELMPSEIRAPSLDRLKEALQHIEITWYCPDDI